MIPYLDAKSDGNIRVHHLTPLATKDSPVLVFCHPTGFCGLTFASVSCHLRGLNVFAIDIRSHGYSDRSDVTNWSRFANDIQSASQEIISYCKTKQIIGVGISSGSSAHILNAANYQDLYLGLYLCEPILVPPGTELKDRQMLADSAEYRRDTFSSRDEAFNKFSSRGPLSMLHPSALALYCTHGFKDCEDGVTLRCLKDDEKNIYLSGGGNKVFEALSSIQAPTNIVYGQFSKTVDAKRAELIANNISDARVEELAGAGHFTLLEQPYTGANSISIFVDSLFN